MKTMSVRLTCPSAFASPRLNILRQASTTVVEGPAVPKARDAVAVNVDRNVESGAREQRRVIREYGQSYVNPGEREERENHALHDLCSFLT
jgi:hypothetical protein